MDTREFILKLKSKLRRSWWIIKYGGESNIPTEVYEEHLNKRMHETLEILMRLNEELPEITRDVYRYETEEHKKKIAELAQNLAEAKEDFEKAKLSKENLFESYKKKTDELDKREDVEDEKTLC